MLPKPTPCRSLGLPRLRLCWGLFIVPLAFVVHPSLLALATTPVLALVAAAKVAVGLWFFSYAVVGSLASPWRRLGALVIAITAILAGGF